MRAIVYEKYGVLEPREVTTAVVPDDGVLVRVRATSINPLDWYFLMGRPYVGRLAIGLSSPKEPRIPGVDFAGTVVSVGPAHDGAFRVGDDVFGAARSTLAELVAVRGDRLAPMPQRASFEEAATLPVAGLTALQALRDTGRLEPGQSVLVNGASGGVGTFAVQIAKAMGASVTGVCHARHVALVSGLGADRVVDYTREDFTRSGRRYDLIVDAAGGRSWGECRRALTKRGKLLLVGGPRTNPWLGPVAHIAGMLLGSIAERGRVLPCMARTSGKDLGVLAAMIDEGRLKPVVARRFGWNEAGEAFRVLGEGHPGGKIVLVPGGGGGS